MPRAIAPRSSAAVRPGRGAGGPEAAALLPARRHATPPPRLPSHAVPPALPPPAEEIACIIEREGMAPVLGAKSRPMGAVAGLLKERDGATRTAALGAIEQAWAEEGEAVWKLLGRWA